MKQITVALCGAGLRGQFAYAPYALKHPQEMRFVAVAEPDASRRERFAREYSVPEDGVFTDWRQLLDRPALADALLICTMDNDHVEPALKALQMGYKHILLEKPIDRDIALCERLVAAAEAARANVQVCHSLRYTRFYRKLKQVLLSGRVGRIINIAHVEGVGYYHQSHSFVRGNWGIAGDTSPMILQKCCHDMDLFLYLTGADCVALSSFGSLSYFTPKNAPEGSAERCIDCAVREDCPYSALRHYGPGGPWCSAAQLAREGFADLNEMLENGRLGRCAFRCGNDVVDHQVVNLLMDGDINISMTMSAFSHRIGRETRIMCTLGEVYANLEDSVIEIHDFASGDVERIQVQFGESGHLGADELMIHDFRRSVLGETPPVTDIRTSVQSHKMAMLAEQARLCGEVLKLG